jgi:hypothetical protein
MSPRPRIGVSIAQNVLAYREQFHQNRLIEHVVPSNPGYREALRTVTDYFASAGGGAADADPAEGEAVRSGDGNGLETVPWMRHG